MAKVETRFVCDLSKPVQAQALKGNVFSLDNLGSRLSVLVYENGSPATISGSVTANCILPDGSTVNVNGTLTTENGGSKAYVDIPQSCLLIPGLLKIAIKVTSSSVITTLAAIVANVYMTKTDNVITPSQQVITDWNAEISAAIATQDAAIAAQDDKITDLKSALDSTEISVDKMGIDYAGIFENGFFYAADGTPTNAVASKLRTKDPINIEDFLYVSSATGYGVNAYAWHGSTYLGVIAESFTAKQRINKSEIVQKYPTVTKVHIALSDNNDGTLVPASWKTYGFVISIVQDIKDLSDTVADNTGDIEAIDAALFGGDVTSFTWVDGFIYNDVASTNANWMRTSPFLMKAGETISFNGGKGDTVLPINAVSSYNNGAYAQLVPYHGIVSEAVTYTANSDIYIIVSVSRTMYSNDLKLTKGGYDSIIEALPKIDGSSFTVAANTRYDLSFTKNHCYLIQNNGDEKIRISLRDANTQTTDILDVQAHYQLRFTASKNATHFVANAAGTISISDCSTLNPFIGSTNYLFGNAGQRYALVDFVYSKDMFNYTDDLTGIDFEEVSGPGGWYLIPDVVTSKFDALATTYPTYVTKVDAGQDVGLTYPAYANMGGEASGDLRPTPTYKTYLYKLLTADTINNNHNNKKKKVLLIGATHGSEIAGSFNLYLFAKNLCECKNEDYFKLRSAFDFYIVPCLNGYGMYHMTRWNANGVNINRNYPCHNWEEMDEPYTDDYTGSSAGSEFETKIVVKLHEKYNFDIGIDHHNYGYSAAQQFYTETWDERYRQLTNVALVDCSYSFIQNKPAYFGTKFKLFSDTENATLPSATLGDKQFSMAKWFYEQNVDLGATIEIGNSINYTNGTASPSASNPKYTADVFAVGEFTLRNQICHYGEFALGGLGY